MFRARHWVSVGKVNLLTVIQEVQMLLDPVYRKAVLNRVMMKPHFWAEFHAGVGAVMFAALNFSSLSSVATNPKDVALAHYVGDTGWTSLAALLGVTQLLVLAYGSLKARMIAGTFGTAFWVWVALGIALPDLSHVPATLAGTLVLVEINLFASGRSFRKLP